MTAEGGDLHWYEVGVNSVSQGGSTLLGSYQGQVYVINPMLLLCMESLLDKISELVQSDQNPQILCSLLKEFDTYGDLLKNEIDKLGDEVRKGNSKINQSTLLIVQARMSYLNVLVTVFRKNTE